jgi:hypothetical protein
VVVTQEKIDLNFNSLVAFLTARGTEASFPTIERLTKASAATIARLKDDPATVDAMIKPQKITDAEWRDMLYFRQAGILTGAVKELKTFLIDPGAYPRPQWAHVVLRIVYEITASSSLLARRCIDDDLADQLLYREYGPAHARGGRSETSRLTETFTLAVGKQLRLRHPDQSPPRIAKKAHKKVNKLLQGRGRRRAAESTVYSHLRKNWARIAPPPK